MKSRLAYALCLAMIATSGRALAHHSFAAAFDENRPVKLTGTVTRVEWSNPHLWFFMDVKNPDGTKTVWVLTTGSANVLAGLGFDSKTIKAGDPVTVNIYGSRNGQPLGFMRKITLADKRSFEFEAN